MTTQDTTQVPWWRRIIELNPLLIRGVLVSVAALLAAVVGGTVIDSDVIDAIIEGFIAITGLITALWARGKVIAENKVIAWNPDPLETNRIEPGLAVVENVDEKLTTLANVASVSASQAEVRAA